MSEATPHFHSRRAAHSAAREGNPFGECGARSVENWIPFPSHDRCHARPGMTFVVFGKKDAR